MKRVFLTVHLVYIYLILAFLCILLYIALVSIINVFALVDLNTGHALKILAFLCILIILLSALYNPKDFVVLEIVILIT